MSATLNRPDPAAARRSAWIPWVFVGGMALVIAVNGVLIWAALSTFTGVTVGRSYDRGLAYNDVLAEGARQQALGWRASLRLEGEALRVTVRDQAGRPVAGMLTGRLERPLEGTSLPLDFVAAGEGDFLAPAALPRRGQWEARLRLTGPDGAHFDIRERMVVQ